MDIDLVIENGCVVTVNPEREILRSASIAINGGVITEIGDAAELREKYRPTSRIDASGKLVLPGFIDSHNHPSHFLSQGFSDDAPLYWRLSNRIWPFERAISHDEAYSGSLGTFASMLLMGTTCFVDPGGSAPEAVITAARDIGIRGLVAQSAQDRGTDSLPIPDEYRMSADEAVASSLDFYSKWNGSEDDRLRVSFSLRDAQTTSDALCQRMTEVARERSTIVQMHLITNREVDEKSRAIWGLSSFERLDKLEMLSGNISLVHLGHVSLEEASRLAETETRVVHCPSASMLGGMGAIGSGGFLKMFNAGVLVSIGTDAAAVSRFLDMIRVMYLAATVHKDIAVDPLAVGAHRALEMATIDGARAIHQEHRIGSLEVGKQADIVVLDTDGPSWQPDPFFDPVSNLVYSADASSVRDVVVQGNVLVQNRKLVHMNEIGIWNDALKARRSVMNRAGIELTPKWFIR
ncbi:amidohydrolase family protein [Rhodococcus sp. NPDC055024]